MKYSFGKWHTFENKSISKKKPVQANITNMSIPKMMRQPDGLSWNKINFTPDSRFSPNHKNKTMELKIVYYHLDGTNRRLLKEQK